MSKYLLTAEDAEKRKGKCIAGFKKQNKVGIPQRSLAASAVKIFGFGCLE